MRLLRNLLDKVGEINARYRQPRIEVSAAVRLALMALRVYLLALVALLIYRFVTIVTQG